MFVNDANLHGPVYTDWYPIVYRSFNKCYIYPLVIFSPSATRLYSVNPTLTSTSLMQPYCAGLSNSSSYGTPQLTQEGAEFHGECIHVVSQLCHSLG